VILNVYDNSFEIKIEKNKMNLKYIDNKNELTMVKCFSCEDVCVGYFCMVGIR
jgi:hypothetical protein